MSRLSFFAAWLLAFGASQIASAQSFERLNIPFVQNGETLAFPLAGGLNNPQLSEVDLNHDGIQDLYIFDREGNRHLTFLNAGTTGQTAYTFAPQYAANFPTVENWALLRDYNNDGAMDLFCYPDQPVGGIIAYWGYYEDNQLKFERFNFNTPFNIIFFPLPGGSTTQIYVSTIDIPAIDDLDCDGDLDIATFNVAGGYIEYYANRSVEMGYGRDSLIFRLVDNCWGGIYENAFSPKVQIAQTINDCAGNFTGGEDDPIGFRHAGSTLLTFDGDGDGDKELILGDVSYSSINYLTNGGTCQNAWFVAQDTTFPSYNLPANTPFFPAAFYLDGNNDGKKDLFVAPNSRQASESYDALWYYENTGTASVPSFAFRKKNFLIEDMVDLGSGAYPVFVDYNADGLQDLVVGNQSYYVPFGGKDARLALFENTGTATQPAFELVDDDWLNMSQFGTSVTFGFAPAFGDLDGDGDLDLLIGEQNGAFFYAQNIAGAGNPLSFAPIQYNNFGIDVGQASVPQIVDLDGDGIMDILAGQKNCPISFIRGLGNGTFAPIQTAFGNASACVPGNLDGFGHPRVLKIDGLWKLFLGTAKGTIKTYTNIDGNLNGSFLLQENNYGGLHEGNNIHFDFNDIDADGWLDMVIGNYSGGFAIFRTDIQATIVGTDAPDGVHAALHIFPNPASGEVRVQLQGADAADQQFFLFDAAGRVLLSERQSDASWQFSVAGFPKGPYFVKVISREGTLSSKLLVD